MYGLYEVRSTRFWRVWIDVHPYFVFIGSRPNDLDPFSLVFRFVKNH
jgi:hypothetical protein